MKATLPALLLALPDSSMDDASVEFPTLADLTRAMAAGDDAARRCVHRTRGPALFRHLLGRTRGDHALAKEELKRHE